DVGGLVAVGGDLLRRAVLGHTRLGHALGLDGLLGQLAALAELHAKLVGQRLVEWRHGAHTLVPHLLGRDHEVLAGHAELLRELDHLDLRRCHVPLPSSERLSRPPTAAARASTLAPPPSPPRHAARNACPSRPAFSARSAHAGSAQTYAPRPG